MNYHQQIMRQLMVDTIRPLSDLKAPGQKPMMADTKNKTLYVRLHSKEDPLFQRISLLLTMFPGTEKLVLYFSDSGKRMAASCLIHEALIAELQELCGDENVVVK